MTDTDMAFFVVMTLWIVINLARVAGHSKRTADALERIAAAAERGRGQ
jgi:hypothetical protein